MPDPWVSVDDVARHLASCAENATEPIFRLHIGNAASKWFEIEKFEKFE